MERITALPYPAATLPVVESDAWHRIRAVFLVLCIATVFSVAAVAGVQQAIRDLDSTPPAVPGIAVYPLFVDLTPVEITVTVGFEKVPFRTTAEGIATDPTVWRRMNFDDWDRVPSGLREQGLTAMLSRYEPLFETPSVWDRMTAHDWDRVPHPVRAIAYRHMSEYWSGFYQVGAEYDLPRRLVADTISAVVMSESWFEHRAVNQNRWGNRDLGVAQASDYARAALDRLHEAGIVDVRFAEADYFDPWRGTRAAALWFAIGLDEVGGDLDAAIRAYHTGSYRALRGDGSAYLDGVKRRRQALRGGDESPAWRFLWDFAGGARPVLPSRSLALTIGSLAKSTT